MESPLLFDNESIPLVTHHEKDCDGHHDDNYDDCNTSNNSKVDETTFATASSTNKQETSTLQLRQKVKQNKLAALY